MTELFKGILIGVITSIISAPILYVLRYRLGFLINLMFFKLYPNVSGEYNVYAYRVEKASTIKDEKEDNNEPETTDEDLDEAMVVNGRATDSQLLDFLKNKKWNSFKKLELKQFANKLTGALYYIKDGKTTEVEKIKGYITASRIIVLNYETIIKDHHDMGTYLLTVKNDAHIVMGVKSFLCTCCGDANPKLLLLEKQ